MNNIYINIRINNVIIKYEFVASNTSETCLYYFILIIKINSLKGTFKIYIKIINYLLNFFFSKFDKINIFI